MSSRLASIISMKSRLIDGEFLLIGSKFDRQASLAHGASFRIMVVLSYTASWRHLLTTIMHAHLRGLTISFQLHRVAAPLTRFQAVHA